MIDPLRDSNPAPCVILSRLPSQLDEGPVFKKIILYYGHMIVTRRNHYGQNISIFYFSVASHRTKNWDMEK